MLKHAVRSHLQFFEGTPNQVAERLLHMLTREYLTWLESQPPEADENDYGVIFVAADFVTSVMNGRLLGDILLSEVDELWQRSIRVRAQDLLDYVRGPRLLSVN